MNYLKKIAPALLLLVIAPLIAEFLLGDFNIRQLAYLGIFVPLYGASALFIREIARRTGRGWPTMLLLAIVFGLTAEGLVNLTLFNPNYAGQHLLAYGFIPGLGTSFNYSVFIVSLHTVWSICTPIALAEGIAGDRSDKPWLGIPELVIVGLLSLLGLVGTAISTIERFHFTASPVQYATIGGIILVLIVLAFRLFRKTGSGEPAKTGNAPSVWLVLLVAFALSSAFQVWFHYAPNHKLNAGLGLAVFLVLDITAILLFFIWSRKANWGVAHILAAGIGAVLTYGWFGLDRLIGSGHTAMGVPTTTVDLIGQIGLLALILGAGIATLVKLRR